MKIEPDFFLNQFRKLTGVDYHTVLPETYEILFDKQDPDTFQNNMQWLLQICKDQLLIEEKTAESVAPIQTQASLFYFEDVSIDGDFQPQKHVFIIGNLTVKGIIYGDIHQMIVVGGTIECRGMLLTRTYLFASGNINARHTLLQHSYGFIMLCGKLVTQAFIEDTSCVICDASENPLEIEKSNDMKLHATYRINMDEIQEDELRVELKQLVPDYSPRFSDGQWQFDELFDFISANL